VEPLCRARARQVLFVMSSMTRRQGLRAILGALELLKEQPEAAEALDSILFVSERALAPPDPLPRPGLPTFESKTKRDGTVLPRFSQ
jgi:hypothetical protein